ncbi:MAG: hypothetical protein K0Q60_3429 [Microvirga sp.]|nr:hypothetical protein [Microvirga sp.]
MPACMYSLSLLRRVRIEMPRIRAAWVRLPKQDASVSGPVAEAGRERVEDQVSLHVGESPADQNLPETLNGLLLAGRGGESACCF